MIPFPANTDSDIASAIARWKSVYDPACLQRIGIPADDFRVLYNPDTPLNVYQAMFDRYANVIYSHFQFSPEAKIALRNKTPVGNTSAADAANWVKDVWGGIAEKAANYYYERYYAIINGTIYYPGASITPGISWMNPEEAVSGLPQDFHLDTLSANTPQAAFGGPFSFVYAVNPYATFAPGQPILPSNGFTHDPFLDVWAGPLQIFKISAGSLPIQVLNPQTNIWVDNLGWKDSEPILRKNPFVVAKANETDVQAPPPTVDQVATELAASGLFKEKTEYITIGDEPMGGRGVVDLKSMLDADSYKNLFRYLQMMPRQILRDFFMDKVWPDLPWDMYFKASDGMPTSARRVQDPIYGGFHYKKTFEDMVWAAFIDMFNEANLDYINKNRLEPWEWEQQKMEAYYVSNNQEAMAEIEQELESISNVGLALDPKAKVVMESMKLMPKLGDVGFEINRQNAIKELLKMKEYETAQAIVDAFRYASETEIGETLSKPIPYDIKTGDGFPIVSKS